MTRPPRVAYFVSSYQSGLALSRLVGALRAGRADVPVVVHHDRGGAAIEPRYAEALAGVDLQVSSEPIVWGDMSLELARWRTLRHIRDTLDVDWVMLLSEQDYPLVPPEEFEGALVAGAADAVVDAVPVCDLDPATRAEMERRYLYRYRPAPRWMQPPTVPGRRGAIVARAQGLAAGAVNRAQRRRQVYRFAVAGAPTMVGHRDESVLTAGTCRFGSAWYALSARAIDGLLDRLDAEPELARHFARTVIPVEAATQSILAACPELTVERRPLHHVRWSDLASGRPDLLTEADLDELRAAPEPFARKVDAVRHPGLLDALDREIAARRAYRQASASSSS